MFSEIELGPWVVRVNQRATQAAYSSISRGKPFECKCLECANFRALGEETYPPVASDIFRRLGVDPVREAELVGIYHPTLKVCEYLGWVHCFGEILSGPTFPTPISSAPGADVARLDLVDLCPQFAIGVRPSAQLAHRPFADKSKQVVQLEFTLRLRWVLNDVPDP